MAVSEQSRETPGPALPDLSGLAATGSELGPSGRLEALRDTIAGRIVLTTSFGLEDQALAHLIFTQGIAIDVVTIDTGRLFPATYELWARTEERYGVRIASVHPDQEALAAFVADAGVNGFYYSREARLACCDVRKVEPLTRALEGAEAWVTGLRADQSAGRGAVSLAQWDAARALIKVSPLFDWTRSQVEHFCAAEKVPVNPLHAEGFLSIGCEPCTRAVKPGDPERAGRWWWETDEAKECGLHVDAEGRLARRKEAA